jgi:hypothetical protein
MTEPSAVADLPAVMVVHPSAYPPSQSGRCPKREDIKRLETPRISRLFFMFPRKLVVLTKIVI